MQKHTIIGLTILVSVLALNPLAATEFQNQIQTKLNNTKRVSGSIASILHKRGLDEDAAERIADLSINGDEEVMDQMIDNLTLVIPHNEIMEYLSTMALHRKEIKLDAYDHLVNMVSQIKKSSLDKNTLVQLNVVAKLNSQLIG